MLSTASNRPPPWVKVELSSGLEAKTRTVQVKPPSFRCFTGLNWITTAVTRRRRHRQFQQKRRITMRKSEQFGVERRKRVPVL